MRCNPAVTHTVAQTHRWSPHNRAWQVCSAFRAPPDRTILASCFDSRACDVLACRRALGTRRSALKGLGYQLPTPLAQLPYAQGDTFSRLVHSAQADGFTHLENPPDVSSAAPVSHAPAWPLPDEPSPSVGPHDAATGSGAMRVSSPQREPTAQSCLRFRGP